MSGPKSSRYTLTAEQRRILEEQRRIEAAKAVANETIKRGIANLRRLSDLSQQDNEFAREAIARLGNDSGYSKKIGENICPRPVINIHFIEVVTKIGKLGHKHNNRIDPQKCMNNPCKGFFCLSRLRSINNQHRKQPCHNTGGDEFNSCHKMNQNTDYISRKAFQQHPEKMVGDIKKQCFKKQQKIRFDLFLKFRTEHNLQNTHLADSDSDCNNQNINHVSRCDNKMKVHILILSSFLCPL